MFLSENIKRLAFDNTLRYKMALNNYKEVRKESMMMNGKNDDERGPNGNEEMEETYSMQARTHTMLKI